MMVLVGLGYSIEGNGSHLKESHKESGLYFFKIYPDRNIEIILDRMTVIVKGITPGRSQKITNTTPAAAC